MEVPIQAIHSQKERLLRLGRERVHLPDIISKILLVVLALVGLPWMAAGAALTASLVSFRR